jgi:hypothetical protein
LVLGSTVLRYEQNLLFIFIDETLYQKQHHQATSNRATYDVTLGVIITQIKATVGVQLEDTAVERDTLILRLLRNPDVYLATVYSTTSDAKGRNSD